jgi:predicted Zn-ribbon and HTH transcriptional regulator
VEEKREEVMDYLQEVKEELEIDELMKRGAREEEAMEEELGEVNEATLRVAIRTMKDYFSSQSKPSGYEIRRIFQKAVEAASDIPGVKEANVWANNFEISEEVVRKDRAAFSAVDGDLEQFALQRMADNSSGRLSKESVEQLHPSNPEREKLFELVGGMPVFLPGGFVSNGRIEPSFSSSYTSA